VKRAANGRVTESGFKKKAMKTTIIQRSEAAAPASVRIPSVSKSNGTRQLHRIDLQKRIYNRGLSSRKVIELLQKEAPRLWELAEVVGKWVWIEFAEMQPPQITAELSQLGFHWNYRRQVWQHPCGQVLNGANFDPRRRFRSYFPADHQAAA
jgi:hypothetical protein